MLEITVSHRSYCAITRNPFIVAVSAPERIGKVGRSRERNRRCHHMTDHQQFLTQFTKEFQRFEEAINLGTQRHRNIKVKNVVKTVSRIPDHSTCIRIPLLPDLAGIHSVIHRDWRRDIEVFHGNERCLSLHRVTHTVAPILHKTFMEEFVLFCR